MPRRKAAPVVVEMEATLQKVVQWLRESKAPMAFVGGVAVAIRGKPRMTADVDAVAFLNENNLTTLLKNAESHGITSRISGALSFARKHRVLLLKDAHTGTGIDIALGGLPFESRMIERASLVQVRKLRVPIASAEDLIVMKAFAHRSKDLADIEGVLDSNRSLDMGLVRRELCELAELQGDPEILGRFEALLREWRKRSA